MNFWIDITNSPHVLFFRPFITKLESEGHNCIVTARKHSQTIDLLNMFKIDYTSVGSHRGKSLIKKAFEYFDRTNKLKNLLKNKDIDAAISHQSPYAMSAARKVGIKKRIYIFDNELAKWQNKLAFRNSTHIVCPTAIKGPYIKYNGLKESIYLFDFVPTKGVLADLKISDKEYIVFRPEPFTAAYYHGVKNSQAEIIDLIIQKRLSDIVLIPRDNSQKEYYKNRFGDQIIIPDKAIDTLSLMFHSSLVVGGGGTMNRESAVLGVPVISTYDSELLSVDRWLVEEGLMVHNRNPNYSLFERYLGQKRDSGLKKNGRKAIDQIMEIITR